MARSQLESIDAGETHLIHAGQPAPDFSLPDADMDMFDLRDLLGRRPFVLYFYIKDGTPGCIAEATEFSDLETEFARLNCPVIGVSRDDCITHAEFRDRHGLAVRLLSDSECEVSTQYGAWQLREIDGISRMGMVRSTFVVDRRGVVQHALYGVTPRGHAAQVLQLVRELDNSGIAHANRQGHRRHSQLSGHGPGR